MSKMTTHNLQCPNCDHKQDVIIYDSINLELNPELKKKLLSAEINMMVCEKCGNKSYVETDLLYHDMTHRFCVQLYPFRFISDSGFIKQFNPIGAIAKTGLLEGMLGPGNYMTEPHIVFDMGEMIRYIKFREKIIVIVPPLNDVPVVANDKAQKFSWRDRLFGKKK
jgi:hypothetical protein